MTLIILCLIPVALLVWYLISQRKPKGFPPGPWGYPFLGHLPHLGKEPHKTCINWLPKYGPIVGIDFASFPCVIITGYKLGKEAWNHPAFSGRPKLEIWKQRSNGLAEGVAFSNERTWKEQRTFVHRELKQLGLGSKKMENALLLQAHELVERLRSEGGAPVDTHTLFNLAFFNTLWTVLAGEPFAQDDPTAVAFVEESVEALSNVNVFTMMSMFMPWFAKYFPNFISRADEMVIIWTRAGDLIWPYVEEHWRTRAPGSPRDFIDAYIDEIEKTTDPESSFHISRGKYALRATLLDLFLGGTDTAAVMMAWAVLLIAKYPDVQEKLAEEIETVLGIGSNGRSPSLLDRPTMAYAEAVLHETMRFRTITPIGGFRSTSADVHFHGYDIPKDTLCYVNFYEAHNDKDLWGDPENFRPERWLKPTADGNKEFVRHEGLLPFGVGKRFCIGEQLARDELFLFITAIVQAFQIGVDPNAPPPTLDPVLGASTEYPKPHKLVFTPRT